MTYFQSLKRSIFVTSLAVAIIIINDKVTGKSIKPNTPLSYVVTGLGVISIYYSTKTKVLCVKSIIKKVKEKKHVVN